MAARPEASTGRSATDIVRTILVGRRMVIREALSVFLRQSGEVDIIAEASTDEEAFSQIAELLPDMVISTYSLPDIDPVRLAYRMTEELHVDIPVLVLTISADQTMVLHAMRSPIAGFMHTAIEPEAVLVAIRAVRRGLTVFGPQARQIIARGLSRSVPDADSLPLRADLTPREQRIVRLIASGLSTKEIAADLGVGVRTVEMHVARIVAKFGARSRTQAVVAALRLLEFPQEAADRESGRGRMSDL